MIHLPMYRMALPLLLVPVFAAGCAEDSGPLTAALPLSTEPLVAAMGNHLQVRETREIDNGANGSIDSRTVTTRWFDAHGNVTREITEHDDMADGSIESRATYRYELNPHGTVVAYTIDHDQYADGSVDNRTVLTTTEFDRRGNPVRQLYAWDQGADGVMDSESELTNEFDSRGNLIRQFQDGALSREMAYDAHRNVVQRSGGAGPSVTSEYNPYDALVHQMTDWGSFGITELRTADYDGRGNPIRQIIESNNTAGLIERFTRDITYDNRRHVLSIVEERDGLGDGSIERRETRTYQYAGDGTMQQGFAASVLPTGFPGRNLFRAEERTGVARQFSR